MGRFKEYLKEVGEQIGRPSAGHCDSDGNLDPRFSDAQFRTDITNLWVAAKALGEAPDIEFAKEWLQVLHPDKIDEIKELK